MNAEILTIGCELLNGSTLNTNARFLGQGLTELGFKVLRQSSCPDNQRDIQTHVLEALKRAHVLILTGGLGPTPDDVTRESLAELLGRPLVFSQAQFRQIARLYQQSGKRIPALVRLEAQFPKDSIPLINRHGIALGFYIRHEKDRWIIVLPGVPRELEKMFQELVRPLLIQSFPGLQVPQTLVVSLTGISEPDVMRRLGKDFFDRPFDFGIYPYPGWILIRLQSDSAKTISRLKSKIKKRLKDHLFSEEGRTLPETLGEILVRSAQSVAVAESCTGGLLSSAWTKIPGASRYFKGGVVAYDNQIKNKVLNVSHALLKKKGAVSGEVAEALARGVKGLMQSDWGIGITGIAGPSGGSLRKPVGTVWFSIVSDSQTLTWHQRFWGDRLQVQERAVTKVFERLWRLVR